MCDHGSQSCKLSRLNSTSSVAKRAWTLRQVMASFYLSSGWVLPCARKSLCSSCTTGTIRTGYPNGCFSKSVAHFRPYCRCGDLPCAFLEGDICPCSPLPDATSEQEVPSLCSSLQQLLGFPLPGRITKCMVTGRKALAIESYRLDLEMQP